MTSCINIVDFSLQIKMQERRDYTGQSVRKMLPFLVRKFKIYNMTVPWTYNFSTSIQLTLYSSLDVKNYK